MESTRRHACVELRNVLGNLEIVESVVSKASVHQKIETLAEVEQEAYEGYKGQADGEEK